MKDGNEIAISSMGTRHLKNTIRVLSNMAQEGVTVRYGGGSCAEDIWYDEDLLKGQEARDHLNIAAYEDELKRREQ
jgi:hypothetical protein